jgi:hypothetical protein
VRAAGGPDSDVPAAEVAAEVAPEVAPEVAVAGVARLAVVVGIGRAGALIVAGAAGSPGARLTRPYAPPGRPTRHTSHS